MTRPLKALFAALRFGLVLSLPFLASQAARSADGPSADILKTDILGVFAHPDDETGAAATLALYARGQAKRVAHVYVTRGEGGGNMAGTQSGPALGILREAELRDCLRILGVRHVYFLDQTDFFYTESLAATLRKWDRDAALRGLVRLVRALRPEIVLTMNPAPTPGQHGHHQAAAVLATEAFAAAADPARYPEQIADEGLHPWQARKLFYSGVVGPNTSTITTTEPIQGGPSAAEIAGEALSRHVSQAFGAFARSPWLRRPQTFTLIQSSVAPASTSSSLFDGLPDSSGAPPASLIPEPAPVRLRFIPRPAITRFQEWAQRHHLGGLASQLPADRPLVAGEENRIELEADPNLGADLVSNLTWTLPDGWILSRKPTWIRDGNRPGSSRLQCGIIPPPDARADAEVSVRMGPPGAAVTASARLHPVPKARVPRVRKLPIDTLAAPEPAVSLGIGTNLTWQGQPSSPADSSAIVRIAHDNHALCVDVQVFDDAVVSNIASDDIKGHWRSDSVEICLDPRAGAEDATETFKIGIFPFDSTGRVRAARDADARQGPVEITAPGLRVRSERTTDGYRIVAVIPFELIQEAAGLRRRPDRLGFNVLVYDGDKADAAPGENINESRLAWAPRAGIQGRPEDWGRIDLD